MILKIAFYELIWPKLYFQKKVEIIIDWIRVKIKNIAWIKSTKKKQYYWIKNYKIES